jgi:broad specificity phosphatase PhoE
MLRFPNGWEVYFCRHGETNMNSSGKLQGKYSNPPLNEKGCKQADALGICLANHFKSQGQAFVLVNGPLQRAHQTAWYVNRRCKPLCHWMSDLPMNEFNEIDFGNASEGMSRDDAIALVHPIWVAWSQGFVNAGEDGTTAESLRIILQRFLSGLTRLYSLCDSGRLPGVVVTHSGLLSIIMAAAQAHAQLHSHGPALSMYGNLHWLSTPQLWGLDKEKPHKINNCSISELVFRCNVDPTTHYIHFGLLNVPLDNFVKHLGELAHAHTTHSVSNNAFQVHANAARFMHGSADHLRTRHAQYL